MKTKTRLYFNLWLVFLASGLWHGAAWGYIVWGAYHGMFLILERLFLGRWLARLGKAAFLYTFFVVMTGWVFFKLEYLHPALGYLRCMFSWHTGSGTWQGTNEFYTLLALAGLFSFWTLVAAGDRVQQSIFNNGYGPRLHVFMACASILLCVISAGRITVSSFNPFIYFRF